MPPVLSLDTVIKLLCNVDISAFPTSQNDPTVEILPCGCEQRKGLMWNGYSCNNCRSLVTKVFIDNLKWLGEKMATGTLIKEEEDDDDEGVLVEDEE